ncbi:unnamed protein product [Cyprideis torosa]|uniref:Uncharacterized protein n=1 Tax=Cyprideis torosa TaxID=163714 RepID=A0A7R8WB42_9CRUS|nr:unnamed protein product [Cyprideis torosa]CAG0885926.1 unnamed protein product [Cyprideis torosa]
MTAPISKQGTRESERRGTAATGCDCVEQSKGAGYLVDLAERLGRLDESGFSLLLQEAINNPTDITTKSKLYRTGDDLIV